MCDSHAGSCVCNIVRIQHADVSVTVLPAWQVDSLPVLVSMPPSSQEVCRRWVIPTVLPRRGFLAVNFLRGSVTIRQVTSGTSLPFVLINEMLSLIPLNSVVQLDARERHPGRDDM